MRRYVCESGVGSLIPRARCGSRGRIILLLGVGRTFGTHGSHGDYTVHGGSSPRALSLLARLYLGPRRSRSQPAAPAGTQTPTGTYAPDYLPPSGSALVPRAGGRVITRGVTGTASPPPGHPPPGTRRPAAQPCTVRSGRSAHGARRVGIFRTRCATKWFADPAVSVLYIRNNGDMWRATAGGSYSFWLPDKPQARSAQRPATFATLPHVRSWRRARMLRASRVSECRLFRVINALCCNVHT